MNISAVIFHPVTSFSSHRSTINIDSMTLIKVRKGHILVLSYWFGLKWIDGTQNDSETFRNHEQMRASGALREWSDQQNTCSCGAKQTNKYITHYAIRYTWWQCTAGILMEWQLLLLFSFIDICWMYN